MTINETIQAIKEQWRGLWPESKDRKGIICPICSHGKNGDGVQPVKEGSTTLHCFGCGFSGDALQLFAVDQGLCGPDDTLSGPSFLEAVRRAANRLGLMLDDGGADQAPTRKTETAPKSKPQKPDKEPEPLRDYTPFFEKAAEALPNSDGQRYLEQRGISLDTAKVLGIGYCYNYLDPKAPTWAKPAPKIIIPSGRHGYQTRDIRPLEEIPEDSKRFIKQRGGQGDITNAEALKASPCWVAEGWADAASIIEAGGNAVAINGTSGQDKLIHHLEAMRNRCESIPVLIDGMDTDGPGRKAARDLYHKLDDAGFRPLFPSDAIPTGCKDANEALQADRKAFADRVEAISIEAGKIKPEEPRPEEEKPRAKIICMGDYSDTYRRHLQDAAMYQPLPTGFANLDEMLGGGMWQGVYTLGAPSGFGKTTIMLQMMDNLAKCGHPSLMVQLEMSLDTLRTKSIQRIMSDLDTPEPIFADMLSVRQIMRGESNELLERAMYVYERDIASNVYMIRPHERPSGKKVMEYVDDLADRLGRAPVVFVDYLQKLAPINDRVTTDKMAIDDNLQALSDIAEKYAVPVWTPCSLTKEALKGGDINREAFSGSAGITYSSDFQLTMERDRVPNDDDSQNVKVVLQKDRLGMEGLVCRLVFFGMWGRFDEPDVLGVEREEQSKKEPKQMRVKTDF